MRHKEVGWVLLSAANWLVIGQLTIANTSHWSCTCTTLANITFSIDVGHWWLALVKKFIGWQQGGREIKLTRISGGHFSESSTIDLSKSKAVAEFKALVMVCCQAHNAAGHNGDSFYLFLSSEVDHSARRHWVSFSDHCCSALAPILFACLSMDETCLTIVLKMGIYRLRLS